MPDELGSTGVCMGVDLLVVPFEERVDAALSS